MNPFGVEPFPATESEFFNAARATVFLLVEGNSDERFWQRWVDHRRCQVRAMGGRDKVIAELARNLELHVRPSVDQEAGDVVCPSFEFWIIGLSSKILQKEVTRFDAHG